jgi:hypothetical protein
MTSQDREEIRRRRNAVDASELDEHRKFARAMLRIRTARAYYEAECSHPEVVKVFQISHHETRCKDCGKKL